ncbi:hypothetical protein KPH14_007166 [Odynerus spinipes]|uniref:Uncharacterized protein n=1 Tax=Odynerus spinipes TaxID=1348599 RepID=A0AAD9RB44_9HYME|nr:hypothetical protein KPH14_007166 [Odynerus spinipes]
MLLVVLLLSCCSIVPILSETSTNQRELLERASAQLQRLTPYRKTTAQVESDSTGSERPVDREKETSDESREREEQKIAMEILQMLEKSEEFQKAIGVTKRIDENKLTIDFVADPRYAEFLQDQERIKRSGSGSVITGSGSIISGIASGLIGGITSASGSASRGSSGSGQPTHVVYGPPVHPYGEKTFDVWDFKKAILNTVIQALKAVSGGVLALKGQLIKGGGFLVSTKGRLISTTGDAISSLGRHIAASAVVQPPKSSYGHPTYTYDHPPEHDSYDGTPPHVEEYSGPANTYDGHSSYPSASDDEERAGLLAVKPTKTEQNDNSNNNLPDLDPRHPNYQDLENSFGGPQKGSNEHDQPNPGVLLNDNKDSSQKNHLISSIPYIQQSQQTYNPGQSVYNKDLDYQLNKDKFPPIYHHVDDQKIEPGLASNLGGQLSIHQGQEYPSFHLQQIQYSFPEKDLATSNYNNQLPSLHAGLPVASPQFDTLKISTLEHQNGLELPKLQAPDFKPLPTFSTVHIDIGAQEPFTLPVLNPIPAAHYWPGRGALQPTVNFPSKNLIWRRSSLQRKKLATRSPASLRDRRPFRV